MALTTTTEKSEKHKPLQDLESVTIRFVGDSGDGMQTVGIQLTNSSAIFGNDVSTLPDYPAEIRAPAGTLAGVSGYQINFSSQDILTPGDRVNTLVVFNPAALRTNIGDLEEGGVVIVNQDEFTKTNLAKAGYAANPLDDGALADYQVFKVPITNMNRQAVAEGELGAKAADRCKNFFALGIVCWLYSRPIEPIVQWITDYFGKKPDVSDANIRTLKAGFYFGETSEMFQVQYRVDPAEVEPGTYRKVTGNEALAMGMIAAADIAKKSLVYASYPITPASDILHQLSRFKHFGVATVQAEDEIAAVCAAIGSAFGGVLAATGTSGPGLCLKSEAVGLAVMTELPLLVINVQRGGPSTGLPTKTEQADLLQALFGRNGESPVPVIAPATPADCFDMVIEAFRIAVRYMTPVIFLSDGYLANGAEPWRIPDPDELPRIIVSHPTDPEKYQPYLRDEVNSRPWAIPGTAGLEHRVGGLEKQDVTGDVSYDPGNHHRMVALRAEKVAGIADDIPPLEINGDPSGDLLVVGWGSTYGAIKMAVDLERRHGRAVSSVHLRYLNPFPKNLEEILPRFKRVLVPEMNLGQLLLLIRGQFHVDAVGLNKVQGRPFMIREIAAKIEELTA
jgi:2-oxoglutarate ferredoxin oxidoreductase subunit alpha